MASPTTGTIAPRLFISYSHDSREHEDRVRNLADHLRAEGIDAIIDQYDTAPPDQWPMWMDREIQKANFVALVCTDTYLKRVEGKEDPGIGRGVLWEAKIIYNHLFAEDTSFQRFIPVLFEDASPSCIPWPLRGLTYYCVNREDGFKAFLGHLIGDPQFEKPGLKRLKPLPVIIPQSYPTSFVSGAAHIHTSSIDNRNRLQTIKRVRLDWIDGVLNRSLYAVARLELGLETRVDFLDQPLRAIVQMPDQPPTTLPTGTPVSKVFDDNAGALLILGAPGVGKTTLLLELAKDLLDRAEEDGANPVPVVFNLSSWAVKRQSLDKWMVSELNERSDVPMGLAEEWLKTEQITPLLDGLDEVAVEYRESCVETINSFRRDHGLLPIAVCSRIADYQALRMKLRLRCAIVVQPLSKAAVQDYLEKGGDSMLVLRGALKRDALLWELLKTPLMLWVAMMAYCNSTVEFFASDNLKQRRKRLFENFVDAMFRRRAANETYTRKQIISWLCWLASAMKSNQQTIFYLENLNQQWLPSLWQRWMSRIVAVLGTGIICGVFSAVFCAVFGAGLIKSTYYTFGQRLVSWAALGMIEGVFFGLITAALAAFMDIRAIEAIGLGPINREHLRRSVRVGCIAGAVVALILGLMIQLSNWLSDWMTITSNGRLYGKLREMLTIRLGRNILFYVHIGYKEVVISGLVFGLAFGLLRLISANRVEVRQKPNQGTRRSLRMAVLTGLAVGLVAGIGAWLSNDISAGVLNGVTGGLLFGLVGGGLFAIRHIALRLTLWGTRSAPLNYIRFLDFSAERIFLRKVGGGYIFIHRMLLEYFGSLKGQPDLSD